MSNRVVLIPFPQAASFEHLVSTQGGNMVPNTENILLQNKATYESAVNQYRIKGLSTDPDVLKSSHHAVVQQAGRVLEQAKLFYDRAQAARDRAMVRGWNSKKFDPQDVVCSDSQLLNFALRKLQAEDDTLFIRGHCSAGSDKLQSSDHSETITVDDLVEILRDKLSKEFGGAIKIYACQSSKDTWFHKSFAKRFAIALSKAGWINCTFYGFNQILKTYVDEVSGRKITKSGQPSGTSRQLIQVPTKHLG